MRSMLIAAIATTLVQFVSFASAQTIYQGPGTYSTYGNQTFGPGGVQSTYGNQTYTQGRNGQSGTTYYTYGNTTYGSNGTTSMTYSNGNQTYIRDSNGQTRTCSTYGNQTSCN
jgi:hypothetical protein